MALEWEFLGTQELRDSGTPGKGYAYRLHLWRTKVPGGWLVMALNAKSNNPNPVLSFYPDPAHNWKGAVDPNSTRLLRPVTAHPALPSEPLLRAADAPDETPDPGTDDSEAE